MDESMIQYAFLFTLFFAWFLTKKLFMPITKKTLPPSPPKLPIIGNLHQLGSLPHRSLHLLAEKHGPLMRLHFGSTPVLVVSSAHAARECKAHDLDLAYRPKIQIVEKMYYNMKSLVSSPYGEYWKQARSIVVHQLLSSKKVQSFNEIMNEEAAFLMNKIKESSLSLSPVNLSHMFSSLSNNVTCRSAFGRKYNETEVGKKFMRVISEGQELLTNLSIGEFIPWLGWINILNGLNYRTETLLKEGDKFLDDLIQERLSEKRHGSKENFLDILLHIYKDNTAGAYIDMDGVKAIIKARTFPTHACAHT
ncbi:unnamed protein product [Fraxinus pennsylvanica]|uniref:Cytochrome P450 n=1 Tax=Fraxinus pennsylvanica TaxID=56036 RepID=A0AAD2DHZ5_9LAMI|nr:unnamed protein product [Fraxinus pennsylvanica]